MLRSSLLSLLVLGSLAAGCGESNDRFVEDAGPGGVDAGAAPTDAGGTPTDAGGGMCTPTAVTCVDESITMLDLFSTTSPDGIVEEGVTAGEFTSNVDARAGGMAPTQSFVYARFTDAGLEKVDIDDEAAFDSVDWDIAFRRYVVRINSGVSGPSCVQAGRTAPGTTFDSLTSVPATLAYRTEQYFTGTCEFVPDGSGIGAPGTALSSYWTYPGCVQMTGFVYVVQLASGRHVKLQVLSYYSPTAQMACDTTDMVPTPSGAAALRVRWAFLD